MKGNQRNDVPRLPNTGANNTANSQGPDDEARVISNGANAKAAITDDNRTRDRSDNAKETRVSGVNTADCPSARMKDVVVRLDRDSNEINSSCVKPPQFYLESGSITTDQMKDKAGGNISDSSISSRHSSRANSLQEATSPLVNGLAQPILRKSRSIAGETISGSLCVGETTEGNNGPTSGAMKMVRKGKIRTLAKGSQWTKLRCVVKAGSVINYEFKKRKMNSSLQRDDSFLRKFSTRNYRTRSMGSTAESDEGGSSGTQQMYMYPEEMEKEKSTMAKMTVIRPEGSIMFYWLAIITLAVLYNLWTCIAREAFPDIVVGRVTMWIALDVLCDVIYVLDIAIQFRTGYLEQGLMVYSAKKLSIRYVYSRYLAIDLISIIPLDFLQFAIGIHPMIRFPRFLKAHRLYSFIYKLESRTQYPNLFRVTNLTHILFLGSHWFAAFYFMISKAENFEGKWSYPLPVGEYSSASRKYLMSLYWSTLTLTTIGDLPEPDTTWEYVFVIVSYLIGVFVFATIVGQVGNVITNRNASRHDFERLLDGAKCYMRRHTVPKDMRKRVLRWYDYVWSRGRMDGSWDINSLGLLPDKLKTELAIHVNLETLKKVTIFQECQPEFLHDLVLKMKAYIFTPGDLICRHGEIAREMFIIADGVVEVISENGTVMTRMSTGDFFGEIGILNLDDGINRRTADVRSVGYSELFVLSRDDVLAALKDHPDAEKILKDYGRQRLSIVRRLANMSNNAEKANKQESLKNSNSSPSLKVPVEDNPSPVTDLLSIQVPSRKGSMISSYSSCSLRSVDPHLELKLIESLEGCANISLPSDDVAPTVSTEVAPVDDPYFKELLKSQTSSQSPRMKRRNSKVTHPAIVYKPPAVVQKPVVQDIPNIVVEPASPEKPTPPRRAETGVPVVDKAVSLVESMFLDFWKETEKTYQESIRSLESDNRLKELKIFNMETKLHLLQVELSQLKMKFSDEAVRLIGSSQEAVSAQPPATAVQEVCLEGPSPNSGTAL